jgi:uncharacterized membrane protein YhaH (DUF805 family)
MSALPSQPPSPRSPVPRLARGPFAVAVGGVYLGIFASQVLLSPPVTAHVGVFAFVLAQVVLIALWIVLHRRRLRDAGRPAGMVYGVAAIYALEVVLLVLLVWLILASSAGLSGGASGEATILHLFIILYLLSLMTGDPNLGALQIWMMGFAAVMVLPVLIAVVFSLWAGTRPSVSSLP